MANYDPLFERLCERPNDTVEMTFDDIEAVRWSIASVGATGMRA